MHRSINIKVPYNQQNFILHPPSSYKQAKISSTRYYSSLRLLFCDQCLGAVYRDGTLKRVRKISKSTISFLSVCPHETTQHTLDGFS